MKSSHPEATEDIKRRLERFIAGPPRNSRVFKITPAIAAWILDTYNRYNRSMKPRAIARFARHMGDSNWAITGELPQVLRQSTSARRTESLARLRAIGKTVLDPYRFRRIGQCVRPDGPRPDALGHGRSDHRGLHQRHRPVRRRPACPQPAVHQPEASATASIRTKPSNWCVRNIPTLPDYITGARAIRLVTGQPMTLVTGLLTTCSP